MAGERRRFSIIVSRWNELITKELLAGALDEFSRHGANDVDVIHVPGTWEIPPAAKAAIEKRDPDGIVALGCILQGGTIHARLLAIDVATGLMSLQVQTGTPISWGVLTPDDMDQAWERSGLKLGNKGREAALAAIEMADLIAKL
jgi:6,7-dimethyl-8-ribityllumazine synthase